jgi:hypothetical protein
MLLEARIQFPAGSQGGCRLVHYHEVYTVQVCLVVSEGLPDDSLQAIARRCLPAVFLGDRQTQPALLVLRTPRQYRKAFVTAAPGFPEDAIVSGAVGEPLVFTEGETAGRDQGSTTRAADADA